MVKCVAYRGQSTASSLPIKSTVLRNRAFFGRLQLSAPTVIVQNFNFELFIKINCIKKKVGAEADKASAPVQ